MPTGGVTPENIKEWIKAGAVAVGTGSELTKSADIGDYDQVTKTAAKFMEELKKARAEEKK
jgi:2-dehydro-3-deoxyphosphogluconate aldolase/(4S)-4-hydroxy-2-oxoglutarate aldolase